MKISFYSLTGIDPRLALDDIEEFFSGVLKYFKEIAEHLTAAFLLYIAVCILLYFCIIKWQYLPFNREIRHSKRVLFITAHPDDECMFFGPTILFYSRKKYCTVYLICLSTGRNYGMGSTRKKELYKSCKVLGIESSNIIVVNHTLLPDSMDVQWPTAEVSQIISHYVESLDITTLVTFDRYGVSLHNNHCSIYYAVANLILDGRIPKCCGVYVLDTTNVLRKYWLFLDIPLSLIMSRFSYVCQMRTTEIRKQQKSSSIIDLTAIFIQVAEILLPSQTVYKFFAETIEELFHHPISTLVIAKPMYIIGFKDRTIIHKAMKKHKSQLAWFRCLYMYFSRYMLMNTLQQMNLVDIELDLEIED